MPQSVIVLDHFKRADGVTVVDEEGNIIYEDLSFELQDILPESEQDEEYEDQEQIAAEELLTDDPRYWCDAEWQPNEIADLLVGFYDNQTEGSEK